MIWFFLCNFRLADLALTIVKLWLGSRRCVKNVCHDLMQLRVNVHKEGRLCCLLLISKSIHNDSKKEWGIQACHQMLPCSRWGTRSPPCSQKAMGKLQSMACCQLNHHPREPPQTPNPRFLLGQVFPEKTTPIGSSCPIQLVIGPNSHNMLRYWMKTQSIWFV